MATTFGTLALISLVGLVGPILALPNRLHLPVVLGELAAGVVLGPTVLAVLPADDATLTFLAQIGFALIMFVAGSRVPVRDPHLREALRVGALRAIGVGVVAALLGVVVARSFGTGHAALYAVLIASSSAALILPIVESLGLGGKPVLELLPQVAVADTACIVALPLVIDPEHAGRAALGAAAALAGASLLFVVLTYLERTGLRRRAHRVSEKRKFALELRLNLAMLFGLAALATAVGVSIMLAGFAFGLAVAFVGEPRRLAKQLFAVSEGFFGPLFFVWLGASLDLRELGEHPAFILLGLALGVGAVVAHLATRLVGQPASIGALASAQLGVPVAAATLGSQLHVLAAGEPAALMLGALVTICVAALAGAGAVRAGFLVDRSGGSTTPIAPGGRGG